MNMINKINSWPGKSRKYGLILIIMVVVISVLMVLTWCHAEKQRRLTARHHLLCEVLQPGMPKDMVLDILKQVGEVRDLDYESQGPEMQIDFVDEKIRET
jgi:hypothetical protein